MYSQSKNQPNLEAPVPKKFENDNPKSKPILIIRVQRVWTSKWEEKNTNVNKEGKPSKQMKKARTDFKLKSLIKVPRSFKQDQKMHFSIYIDIITICFSRKSRSSKRGQ